jgi:ribosomal protein S6
VKVNQEEKSNMAIEAVKKDATKAGSGKKRVKRVGVTLSAKTIESIAEAAKTFADVGMTARKAEKLVAAELERLAGDVSAVELIKKKFTTT